MGHFIVKVERAPEAGAVRVGDVFEVTGDEIVLGRSESADVTLGDSSVSTHHVTLRALETGFVLHNASARGSTWVDQRALAPDEQVDVLESAWIQLGRLLLHVSRAVQTTPISTMYSLPSAPSEPGEHAPDVFLSVDLGLHASVRVMGREQQLFPMALRMLWRLAEDAGEVVGHGALKDALSPTASAGGLNVAQNVTYIRDMFEKALDLGELTEDELREELEVTLGPARVAPMERRELLRALVQNVRGRGYRLNLSPKQVDVRGPAA